MMESRQLRFPRLNLVPHHLTELTIHGSYEAGSGAAFPEQLTDRVPGVEAGVYASFTGYTARDKAKTRHSIAALLWRADDNPAAVKLSVAYIIGDDPGRGGPRALHRESEFLSLLETLGHPSSLRAIAEFRFSVSDATKLTIPLPVPIGVEHMPFGGAEIRGVRIAMPHGERLGMPDLNMIVDRPAGRDVFLDLRFAIPIQSSVSPDLPRAVLDRAGALARLVVRD
jgi:hypothetical protein